MVEKKGANKEDKSLMVIFVVLGLLLILVIGLLIVSVSNKSINYNGLEFKKTSYGQIILYSVKVPVLNSVGKVVSYFQADFRNNPKTLENVSVESKVELGYKDIYLSVAPIVESCEDSGLAVLNLAAVFLPSAGHKTKLGSLDKEHAIKENVSYITCQDSDKYTVLTLDKGNETKITKEGNSCYELTFADCADVTRVTEKFQLSLLEEYNKRLNL